MAEQVMTKMRSMAIKPNLVTYTALISICGKTGDVQQALVRRPVHDTVDAGRGGGVLTGTLVFN